MAAVMKQKTSKASRSAKKPTPAKKPKYRKQTAKDAFGEQLLKRKGSIDPDVDLEF
jgi:hypothetical protein